MLFRMGMGDSNHNSMRVKGIGLILKTRSSISWSFGWSWGGPYFFDSDTCTTCSRVFGEDMVCAGKLLFKISDIV